MAARAYDLGFDDTTLRRRLHFLRDRARAHDMLAVSVFDEASADLHRACAATLRRDAAAVALLLDDMRVAKADLIVAGKDLLELGLFYGAFLLSLGDRERNVLQDMTGWIDEEVRNLGGRKHLGMDEHRPFAGQAARNPRQLLSLVQADIGTETTLIETRGIAREQLTAYRALPLGATGTTIGRYVGLLDELRYGDLGEKGRETLIGLAIFRRELIETAQQDGFHWRRLHQPAGLIDFDILALGLAAQAGGQEMMDEAIGIMGERGVAVSLPFELARELDAGGRRPITKD